MRELPIENSRIAFHVLNTASGEADKDQSSSYVNFLDVNRLPVLHFVHKFTITFQLLLHGLLDGEYLLLSVGTGKGSSSLFLEQ